MFFLIVSPFALFTIFAQPSPPHVSAITPPPIPEVMVNVHHATNRWELTGVPHGAEVKAVVWMAIPLDVVTEMWRTNRSNCYIVVIAKPVEPSGQLMSAPGVPMLMPEDIEIISNYHRLNGRVIIVPQK
jgi:hypothetical protein